MILQALHDLYARFERDPDYDVAPEGFSLQKISFVVVLEADGTLHEFQDHREGEGNRRRARVHLVPGAAKPSGAGINPCFCWDNSAYLLGYKPDDPKPERTRETFEASRALHLARESEINLPAYAAVCRFFEAWNPERVAEHPVLKELTTGFGVFQIRGSEQFVHEEPALKAWWIRSQAHGDDASAIIGNCLITGERGTIADLHEPKIKGVKDAQGAGALIVSFNTNAYESYGKRSGLNAPVSAEAAAKYCKALNALLSSERHRIQIGDATTVFWTDGAPNLEGVLPIFFNGDESDGELPAPAVAQRRQLLGALHGTLRALQQGGPPDPLFASETGKDFYVLGLTGQAGGRLGVRFWFRSSVGDFLHRLADHQEDLEIVRPTNKNGESFGPEFPMAPHLLDETARDRGSIAPNLSGDLLRAILQGTSYPQTLMARVMTRIRIAEKDHNDKPRERVPYLRAAILKAFLNRNHDLNMTPALDKSRNEPAYHLGRLFAVYETAQRHAHDWKLERTIRETMYSAASATPLSVFGRLERLFHHHTRDKTKKYPPGSSESYADIVGEISQNFRASPPYPASLNLVEQSLFAVGYYHQHHALRQASRERAEPAVEAASA